MRSRLSTEAQSSRSPTHVLYIIDQLCQLGGAESMLLEMVNRLPSERFRCSVVTFELGPGLWKMKGLQAKLHVLPLDRTYNWRAAKTALRLCRLIRQEHVSIVHTFFETSDLWAAPIAKFSGCPVLISSRRDMGIQRARKHQLVYPLMNWIFDRILTVSHEVRSFCLRHDRISSNRVETLYNGIDLEKLDAKAVESDARNQLGLNGGAPVISTLANIRGVKGIDVLARAAKRVCGEFPEATFLIGGRVLEPQIMSELRTQVESLQLANKFRFIGELANPFPVLKASDVFCLPSRSEGFSNALIEAMGCGLPCVATRVGGNAEACAEGTSGYLVDSEDSDAMAEGILRLLRNPVLARQMGQAGRERVKTQFSMEAMMNRLMNLYDELLAAKNA